MALRQVIAAQQSYAALAEPQQAQFIGHSALGPPQTTGGLLLTHAVDRDQPGDGSGLLHIVQVAALQIFDEGQKGAVPVGDLDHHAGHMAQPRKARGPQPALPRHQNI